MKNRWYISLLASIPVVAAVLALQSCGGVGGPTTDGGDGGSNTQAFLALLSDEQRSATSISPEACADCHGGRGQDDPIYAHWQETKHFEKGVTCESCHGPGSAHQASPSKTNILTYPKLASPVVCAQCHGPTHEEWKFSQHSKLIASPVERAATDPNSTRSSQCISCHSGLSRARINEQGQLLSTATNELLLEVAEGTINHVPHTADCVTCHDPHAQTENLTDSGEQAQIRRKVFNTDTAAIGPGTTADSFTNYDHVCAQCHNGRGTNPADARLNVSTSRPSMHDSNQMQMLMGEGGVEGTGPVQRNTAHATAPGQCTKCHMPDSRHSFTVSFDKGCAPCHTAADAAARTTSIKSEILDGLVALKTKMEAWAEAEFGNDLYWEYTSTITAEGGTPPNQSLIPIEVKRARYNYYFVIRSGDYGVHNAPYAKHLIQVANQNMDSLGNETARPSTNRSRLTMEEKLRIVESDRLRTRNAEIKFPE